MSIARSELQCAMHLVHSNILEQRMIIQKTQTPMPSFGHLHNNIHMKQKQLLTQAQPGDAGTCDNGIQVAPKQGNPNGCGFRFKNCSDGVIYFYYGQCSGNFHLQPRINTSSLHIEKTIHCKTMEQGTIHLYRA